MFVLFALLCILNARNQREKTSVPADGMTWDESMAMGWENEREWWCLISLATRIKASRIAGLTHVKLLKSILPPFQQLELCYLDEIQQPIAHYLCSTMSSLSCLSVSMARCCWMLLTARFNIISQMRAYPHTHFAFTFTRKWRHWVWNHGKNYHLNSTIISSYYLCMLID